ncbi:MAG: RidA family protein [Proteobacteria bacterium]|nr:RidA family protein [Pseudomonadota bacterium]
MHRIYTSRHGAWRWPFALTHRHGLRCGDLMFVGGQAALDRDGAVLHPGDAAAQTTLALRQVEAVLGELGGRLADVAKLIVFHVYGGAAHEADLLRRIRALLPGAPPPVISMMPLPRLALPGLAVTIDAVALPAPDAGGPPRAAARPRDHWPFPSDGEFSHGLRCGDFVFVAAQMARDAGGRATHHGDIVGQARATMANIGKVLAELGCGLDDVVKLNTWYSGDGTDADWRKAAEIRANAFRYPGPGATGVPVPGPFPDGVLLRQECWALPPLDGVRRPRALSWPVGHWNWPIPVSFQQGLKVGKLIVLGGQIATDLQCKAVHPGDMRAQAANVMESIRNLLAGFDATMEAVVKLTCFYKTTGAPRDLAGMLAVCSACFAEPGPPITFAPLENLGFEDVTLEIEALALLD